MVKLRGEALRREGTEPGGDGGSAEACGRPAGPRGREGAVRETGWTRWHQTTQGPLAAATVQKWLLSKEQWEATVRF